MNSPSWNGDIICDSDDVASRCKWFKPAVDPEAAKREFLKVLSDDRLVYDKMKDVATLQWVLGERVHKLSLSLWERFVLFFVCLTTFVKKPKPTPDLPSLEGIWFDEHDSSQRPES